MELFLVPHQVKGFLSFNNTFVKATKFVWLGGVLIFR